LSVLVGRGRGVRSRCKADSLVGSVEDGVEALQESVAVDEVETLAAGCTEVVDNEVDGTRNTTNISVEGTRPNLSVGGKGIRNTVGGEDEVLQVGVLGGSDFQETGGAVESSTGCRLVLGESVAGEEDEGGS